LRPDHFLWAQREDDDIMNPPPRFPQARQDGTYATQETFTSIPAARWLNTLDPFPPVFSFPHAYASPFADPTLTLPSVNSGTSNSVPSQPAVSTNNEMLQDVGPQPGATVQRRRHDGQYTDAVWSQHRPKIKELYMDQNLTLKQTMGKMKEHGFCPSWVPNMRACMCIELTSISKVKKCTRRNSTSGIL
jgi:Clr5-like protein